MAKADEVFGFDELVSALNRTIQKYPDGTDAMLMALGQEATKRTKGKTPVGKTKKLRGSWRLKKPKLYGSARVVRTQSTAPHAHLVEDGHEIVRGGKARQNGRRLNVVQRSVRGIQSKGRVEGKKMLETAFREIEARFNQSAENLLDELTKEAEL